MCLSHFYTKINPLCDTEGRTLFWRGKILQKIIFPDDQSKNRKRSFSHTMFPPDLESGLLFTKNNMNNTLCKKYFIR